MRTSVYLRYLITAAFLLMAVLFGKYLWDDNMTSPWTRDGRIKADIIHIAPDVSGVVTQVAVHDNQFVHKGDILFTLDRERYQHALSEAQAFLAAQQAEKTMRGREAARRQGLDAAIVTSENREAATSLASAAAARYQAAAAARDVAQLNLARTEVRAPVDGFVTNLHVHTGDYAANGSAQLALIDSHSFYVSGYFEETKLPYLAVGDAVEVRLMSSERILRGHIDSVARGITDRDGPTGKELLADVNPTFNWVRLAQRIPVRIQLDHPDDMQDLIAGMTCTVTVLQGHTERHAQSKGG
ncbi:MAG: efflux RND transporter periplasmic adaptor subunit [Oxalicibacterium faecigallinarum]|uniref:efflux RND transporter periplasmic adaptor subunit n=1 Tax=Oxalicibacterium faecigallinarum TaxID=573741 RepID=UPI002808BBCF|nr:efflux RND transporter periplasmic adaptor subunit [Oxalicibacterium faecigallinarum]MDQ7970298.1 efflux RND transporter periplasmic adaptor subunit [Oxalicibacterium faecigallinarum]